MNIETTFTLENYTIATALQANRIVLQELNGIKFPIKFITYN